jgi:uncharacterized protein (DUF58 family)
VPMFRVGIINNHQNNNYHHMNQTGRILIAIILIVGCVGVLVTGAAMYTRLVLAALLIVAISWLWSLSALYGIRISRSARSLKASVGDVLEENFEITNPTFFPRLWLEIANETPLPSASGSRLVTMLNGKQRRFYLARTWLIRRGAFSLGPTVIRAGDPFGLFRVEKEYPASKSLIVLPLIFNIADFPSPPGLLPGGKAIRRKSMDITPHASGVREYVTGDPIKSIHWASTARRDRLMVKEFEQDPQAEVWVVLDTQAGIHYELPYDPKVDRLDGVIFKRKPIIEVAPSTMEYGVSIAASLAHYFIQQRRAVGFVAAGQVLTVISAERSDRQENKILETLAFVKDSGQLSLAGVVAAQAKFLPIGSSVILITPSVAPDVFLAVDELQRRNLHPLVILMMVDSFGGSRGSERLAQSLIEVNIPVCQVSCGDDLPKSLAEFAAQNISQEMRQWQKPLYIP